LDEFNDALFYHRILTWEVSNVKIFKVEMRNSLNWISSGGVATEVYIQADGFVGATAYAEDVVAQLGQEMGNVGRLDVRDDLRITSITEISEFLQAEAPDRAEQLKDWAARKAQLIRKQS